MAQRRVLIVDDSKTAQVRLKKMLQRFEVEVDTVFSAEEALGYLSYKHPAAIFMDHHMEGMDGLEALKIIKSNPDTALIPVIMYTSESGDVYVGQARALGALDIIGKQVIQHANIEKVLGSLGIAPTGAADKKKASKTEKPSSKTSATEKTAAVASTNRTEAQGSEHTTVREEHASLEQVQQQIGKLFELHIAKVRQEIEDSTKFLVRRLSKESSDRAAQAKAKPKAPAGEEAPPELPLEPYLLEPPPEKASLSALFLGIILISIAFVGYHIYINNRHQVLLAEQYQNLIKRTQAQENLIGRLFEKVSEIEPKIADPNSNPFNTHPVLLDAMGWATSVNTSVPFGERALNDERIFMLGDLLYLMKTANFTGTIYLDVHMGNFCVVETPSGELILPDPESNLEDCIQMASMVGDANLEDQVSVGFLNFVNTSPVLLEGEISVDLSTEGFSSPRFSYPVGGGSVRAGDWNAVALKNNRIVVSFSSD